MFEFGLMSPEKFGPEWQSVTRTDKKAEKRIRWKWNRMFAIIAANSIKLKQYYNIHFGNKITIKNV